MQEIPEQAKLVKLELQPLTNWYLIHRMSQYGINIRIYFVCQIWRRMLQ
jgi:hypothetical protein